MFYAVAESLAEGEPALLRIDGGLTLTSAGRAVLHGEADAVALRGIDRWVGGVHLAGREARWRWDAKRGVLVA